MLEAEKAVVERFVKSNPAMAESLPAEINESIGLTLLKKIKEAKEYAKHAKPGDRSEKDRYWAMVISKLDEAEALFAHNCM